MKDIRLLELYDRLLKNEDIDTTLIELQRDLSTKFAR